MRCPAWEGWNKTPSMGCPPSSTAAPQASPPHLEQLDGHSVVGEGLEQIQSPFLECGEAMGAP